MYIPEHIYQKGLHALQLNQEVGIGSHLQAGARAQAIDDPLTKALCSRRGRMLARTVQYVFRGNVEGLLNYAAMRPYGVLEGIKIALGDNPNDKVVLDPAAGYSPVFYWLAKEYPNTQFIEVDTHEVIEYKRAVYNEFGMPSNLRLRPIDLQQQELHTAISEKVDVMIALGAYVTHKDFRDMLEYLEFVLREDAHLIAPFPYTPGIDYFTDNSFIFSNMVSTPRGAIKHENELTEIFKDTHFTLRQTIKLSDLAEKQGKPTPANIEIVSVVQRQI